MKLAWIFLGSVVVCHIIVFPVFNFSPPKSYGYALIVFYCIFFVLQVLDLLGLLQVSTS